jgi:hypothetical protein
MVRVGLIKRRPIWKKYTVEKHTVYGKVHWSFRSQVEVRKTYEYRITLLGELLLRVLNKLTALRVLPA